MVRRYYRRTPRSNKDKYSVEQTFINMPNMSDWTEVPATEGSTIKTRQFSIPVIPPTDEQGMRKVKHFLLTFDQASMGLAYALVYVPQGYTPNPINYPADGMAISMYEPNQFVLSQGVVNANLTNIRTPLSRNLNSGDSIYLIAAIPYSQTGSANLLATVRYAITLQ